MEGLYLLHTREFITTEMPIYKIGRGDNVQIRVSQYPNGSHVLLLIRCKNSKLCEKKLIAIFKQKFIQEKYYGSEYFSGNCDDMIDVMTEFIKIHNKKYIADEKKKENKEKKEKKEKVKLKVEVKTEVLPEVKSEIKTEVLPEVKADVLPEVKTEVLPNVKSEVLPEVLPEVKPEVLPEVKTEVLPEVKTEIVYKSRIKSSIGPINDRTCPTCFYKFKYPTMLRQHFKKSFYCLKNDNDIDEYFNPSKIKCITCSKTFSQTSSLYRHQRLNNCNTTTQLTPTPTLPESNNKTITTIQTIIPFSYEDISQIPISELKPILNNLLTSNIDIFSNVINFIYSKIENKNFYKPNLSKPEIAILNTNFNITLYNYKDFIVILFDRCINLLQNMLYLCKNEFINSDIVTINNNINNIVNINKDVCCKQIQIIIETVFRNNNINNKNNIKNIKTFINKINEETDSKKTLLDAIKNIVSFNEKTKEYINSINN